ncbi:MAG: pantoate--beta-alanine ligase [Acetobacteraceae bacterium]
MLIARTLPDLRASLTAPGGRRKLALVPTMGALHAGHHALVAAAVASGALVVASIFVNPLQFGQNEDIARYPRDEPGDLAKLREWGCQVVWLPDVTTMYPEDDATTIVLAGPAEGWEGAARPGHFRGVATVVAKLFGQVRPDTAYFGEKDWQQLQVVRRMVDDLHLPVEVIGVPTARADDGLALSSRNQFLTPRERGRAPRLYAVLTETARAIAADRPIARTLDAAREALGREGFSIDYLDLVDGRSLTRLTAPRPDARLIAAARLGTVRLLDNVPIG